MFILPMTKPEIISEIVLINRNGFGSFDKYKQVLEFILETSTSSRKIVDSFKGSDKLSDTNDTLIRLGSFLEEILEI